MNRTPPSVLLPPSNAPIPTPRLVLPSQARHQPVLDGELREIFDRLRGRHDLMRLGVDVNVAALAVGEPADPKTMLTAMSVLIAIIRIMVQHL